MRTRFRAMILVILAAIPAAARQTSAAGPKATAFENPPAQSAAAQAATQDPAYVIGPEDVLDVSVWKNADLTRTVPVRPDGKITLPLLNDIQAAGLTPDQLKNNLTQSLTKYMTDPIVTVIVTQINSQRFYVSGEVNHPGASPLLPQMTVLQGLATAGGFTQFANTKKIYIIRMVDGKQVNLPFNYKDVIRGKNTDQNVVLKPGDQIVVP